MGGPYNTTNLMFGVESQSGGQMKNQLEVRGIRFELGQ